MAGAAEGKVVAYFLLLRETWMSRQVSQKMATRLLMSYTQITGDYNHQ